MVCKNLTCSQPSKLTYCSPRCKEIAGRCWDHLVGLPDVRVGMDTERAIRARAKAEGVSVKMLLLRLIEQEFGDVL